MQWQNIAQNFVWFIIFQVQIDFHFWQNCWEIVRICIRRDDDEKQERKYYSLGEKTNVIWNVTNMEVLDLYYIVYAFRWFIDAQVSKNEKNIAMFLIFSSLRRAFFEPLNLKNYTIAILPISVHFMIHISKFQNWIWCV